MQNEIEPGESVAIIPEAVRSPLWDQEWFWTSVGRCLTDHDCACYLRRVNKAAAAAFWDSRIHLSRPCPLETFRRRWGVPGATRSLNLKQRRQLIALTAASGVMENLKVAFLAAGCAVVEQMMELPAAAGQLPACEWLRQHDCPWGDSLSHAAGGGHTALAEWMLANDCPWSPKAVYAAARGGHVELMARLEQHGNLIGQRNDVRVPDLIIAAAAGFELGTLQQLFGKWLERGSWRERLRPGRASSRLTEDQAAEAVSAAAFSHARDWQAKVAWLKAQGCTQWAGPTAEAVKRRDAWERVVWMGAQGYSLHGTHTAPRTATFLEDFCRSAGARGDPPRVSDVLCAISGHPSASELIRVAAEAAAAAGHLEFLRALVGSRPASLGEDLARSVVLHAARGGHQHVVLWLESWFRSLQLGEDPALGDAVWESGNVRLLSWVRGKVVKLEPQARGLEAAILGGCEEALTWCENLASSRMNAEDARTLYYIAARNGDLVALRWLHARLRGKGLDAEFLARYNFTAIPRAALQWLRDATCGGGAGAAAVDVAMWEAAGVESWLGNNRVSINSRSTGATRSSLNLSFLTNLGSAFRRLSGTRESSERSSTRSSGSSATGR